MGVRQRAKVSHTAVQGFESGCWKSEPNFFRRASSELDGALGPGYEPAAFRVNGISFLPSNTNNEYGSSQAQFRLTWNIPLGYKLLAMDRFNKGSSKSVMKCLATRRDWLAKGIGVLAGGALGPVLPVVAQPNPGFGCSGSKS